MYYFFILPLDKARKMCYTYSREKIGDTMSYFTLVWVTLLGGFLFPPLWLITFLAWIGYALCEFDYDGTMV